MNAVYIDEVFITNGIMNFLILLVVKKIIRGRASVIRLIAGAIAGALYAVGMVFQQLWPLYTFVTKLAFSLLLVLLTFGFGGIKTYIKNISVFFIVSFGFGGAVYGVISLMQYGGRGLPLIILIVSSAIAYGLITLVTSYHRMRLIRDAQIVKLSINMYGRTKEILGFVDTGNTLYEPFTSRPVLVVERKKINDILPGKLQQSDIVYIPYSSVGNENSCISGIRPDEVAVYVDDEIFVRSDITIGVYDGPLSADNSYDALINPIMFRGNSYENHGT